jgi:hypothetical protein
MRATDRRVIAAVCALVAIVAAWLVVIEPKRSQATKLGSELSAAQAQVNSARAEVTQDQAARASFATDYAEVARLGEAVPADDDVPSMLYQLQSAASATHVDFRSLVLVPGSSTSAPAAPASTAPKSSSSSSSSASASSSATSTAATAATAAGTLPPGAAIGPAGFPTEQFTLTFQGNFFHLSDFFKRLEAFVQVTNKNVQVSGRLMTLNAITLGAAPAGFPQMQASVSATTYLVPAPQGLLAGASPTGPGASSTSSVSGSANPASVAPATVAP